MALQVWLPLNGNLENKGIKKILCTSLGTVAYQAGKIGTAFKSGGETQVTNGISLNTNFLDMFNEKKTCSVAVWVKPLGNHYHYNGTILSSGDWNTKRWAFGVSQDNTKVDVLCYGHNTYVNCSVPVNEWTHLVSVYNNKVCTLYKNGEFVASYTCSSDFDSDAQNTCIGRETYANGYFGFNGLINDIRIYDHCLSKKEIKDISKGLVLHYKLDKTSNILNQILPPGIELYDSLQGDGKSWINTLIPYDSTKTTYKIQCKFSQPANIGQYDAVFGAYRSESHKTLRILRLDSNARMAVFYNTGAGSAGSRVILSGTNSDIKEVVMTNSSVVCTVNGTSTTYNYGTAVGTDTQSIFYLFVQGDLQNNVSCLSNTILYYWTIWDGNTMLGNFIPATFHGEPGMYDTVTKKFFHNIGTGNFILGNKISLIEYEYLQCDTASYIKSGIIPTTSTNFEMKYATSDLNNENVYFGCSTQSGYANGNNYSLDILKTGSLLYTFKNKAYDTSTKTTTAGTPFIVKLQGSTFSIDGTSYPANRHTSHPNIEVYLFARNVANAVGSIRAGKIYYCKFWEGNTILRDFIPVSCNGVLGLFDKFELKFYPNAGTGSFTSGPIVTEYVYDCSGYKHNGTLYGTFTQNDVTPRHSYAVKFNGSDNSIGIGNLSTITPSGTFTFNCWFKVESLGSKSWGTIIGGPSGFEFQSRRSTGTEPTLVAYSWGQSGSGGQPYTLNTWNMVSMVRTTSNCKFYLNGELYYTGSAGSIPSGDYFLGSWKTSSRQNYKGLMSDARLYATALSASDIKELYDDVAMIDKNGNLSCYEFDERGTEPQIGKTGVVKSSLILEGQTSKFKVLSDGSVWVQLLHHNNPSTNLFTQSNCWNYDNGTNLYSALFLLKNGDFKNSQGQYEFLACEKLTSASTETVFRWKQTSNPSVSSTITGFSAISGSSSYSYRGLLTNGNYGCMHNGNTWWGCCGSYTPYQGGIPGFGNVITTGYLDLYVRVSDEKLKGSNISGTTAFYKESILTNQLLEY
jgi:hypothetical protein